MRRMVPQTRPASKSALAGNVSRFNFGGHAGITQAAQAVARQ
jgi:hypothetical protein